MVEKKSKTINILKSICNLTDSQSVRKNNGETHMKETKIKHSKIVIMHHQNDNIYRNKNEILFFISPVQIDSRSKYICIMEECVW